MKYYVSFVPFVDKQVEFPLWCGEAILKTVNLKSQNISTIHIPGIYRSIFDVL